MTDLSRAVEAATRSRIEQGTRFRAQAGIAPLQPMLRNDIDGFDDLFRGTQHPETCDELLCLLRQW